MNRAPRFPGQCLKLLDGGRTIDIGTHHRHPLALTRSFK